MQGIGCKEPLLLHLLLNVGEINQRNKLNKQLPFQGTFGRSHRSLQIQPLFDIPECLLHDVPHSVKTQCCDRILDFIADQNKESIALMCRINGILFDGQGDSPLGGLFNLEVLLVLLLVFRYPMPAQKFIPSRILQ